MSDCHPAPFGSNLLLAPASQISSDQLSTFSATNTDQSSPPYSGHDPQYSTPESHYNDRESPSSDQLNIDANPSDFSPEAETSSDRDESPDTDSTSSGAHDSVDIKTESDTVDLQREILRLQSFANTEDTKPPSHLNLLAAFNNQLLNTKFASNFLADQLAPKPATPTVAQLTSTLPQPTPESATPTKRKRQRRNPVWPYFDVIDGTAKCKQCLYTTKSVFSTNLKVHLRSHHRSDYEKVIAAEDALNLNALLMSGNASKFLNPDTTRKRIPPMTSSILMTINKLANQQNEDNPLHSVLRQTLAAGTMQQLQQQMAQQQQQKPAQIPLNAANLAALNNLARLNQNGTAQVPSLPTMAGADSLFSQFNFANVKQEVGTAPHGTDPNGMPQPKRRRLRRHPVWMFFRDLEDRMVGCINCNFRTGSAFSTNLKMHLKAHHKDDYERVLKLEDDMRMEEGIPNNKIKSELIDYIRGGGNASTPPSINSAIPKPSPLVQQFISQTMAGRTGPPTPKKDNVDDDPFNGMSMSDKLAALVGLTPAAGRVEGEVQDEKPLLNPLEEFKRTFLAANMGLQPPPQEQTLISLNGTILHSDAKSTSSASTDVSGEDKKTERDRALAKFWVEQGGNDELLSNDVFKILFDSLIPEETKEENEEEQEETSSSIPSPGPSNPSVSTDYLPTSTCFEISTLTYESLFDSLSSFEKSLGLSEASACIILTDLLKSSAKTDSERATVETVCAGLEKIASLEFERDKQERMRKLVSEKMKLKRLFETPDQRAQRLERMRARYRSTRTGETGMKKEKTDEETESAKEERLKKLREYQRRRLERELPEQRERRLAKMRMNQKLRRERQSKEKEMSGGLDLLRALAPDYDMPDASHLAALVDEDQLN